MAVLHVKSPNGTTYNMTIVTSGSPTESLQQNGWGKFPNGIMIQWGYTAIITTLMGEDFQGYIDFIRQLNRISFDKN